MEKFLETNRLHHLLTWTLLGLLLVLLILEGWRYGIKPSEVNNEQLIEHSLNEASDHFLAKQKELLDNTERLAANLQPALLQDYSHSYLSNTLNQFPEFWGAALFHEDEPIVWRGFSLQSIDNPQRNQQSEPGVTLKKHNNVIYWECHIPFSLQDSSGTISYDLFSSYRVKQDNLLSIGDHTEFNLFDYEEFSTSYPLNFNIFSDPPTQFIESQQLSNLQGDSVGVVYATIDQFEQTKALWEQNTRFWRSVYAVLCFIVLVIILFVAVEQLSIWSSLVLQLFFVGIGWGVFAYTNMPSYWILTLSEMSGNEWVTTVENLSSTFTNALFVLLAAITTYRKLKRYQHTFKADWYLSTIGLSGLFGIINALSIISFFHILFQAVVASGVPMLDLRIFPATGTIILYLVVGIATLGVGCILTAINQILFRVTKEHLKLSTLVLSVTFFINLFVVQLFVSEQFIFNWMFYSSIFSFGIIIITSASLESKDSRVSSMSSLRKVVLGSFVIAIVNTPVIYQASLQHVDNQLRQTATNYIQKEDPYAEKLTRELLTKLELSFRDISEKNLQENQSTLQTRFINTIQSSIAPEWNAYSFNLQLINTDGELIADYATNLNSPNWVNIFGNISTLETVTEMEQITKSTIQPVVQLPELINQEDYRTFYRGWIPIFGISTDTPIAWILCSIYQERPQFNKPIRAVMASLTYDDWNTSYLMQRFQNGRLVNSVQQGFAGYFPKYRTLEENKLQALEEDSLIYMNEQTADNSYRTLLWKETENLTIKISTTKPDFRLILYSFFRLSFTLLLVGCLGILLWQLLYKRKFEFFERNKRFQDRILDSFLLATLIFLTFLIATSHYAIKQQNQDIVRQELVDKLERLSKTIESNPAIRNNRDLGSSFSLDTLTMPLDADASFYAGRKVTETTTPQIYQQHLLPNTLPYEIYHKLFHQQHQDAYSTVQLADQNLLIGYRSILNEQSQPVATIAIPTFLESPKYQQQLLETTSYLILIYLLVFGLFILGSTFISRQLTRPLVYIQRGLNKISGGNLDTTIPVKSNDEIGTLAEAYNNMVYRLKKLQKELATAEREAAWKEMAQQVAHEIKNPLTPMKLNVQHLERQLKDEHQNPDELKKRVQKITENLIDQIQTLNNIASDFSKFSQPLDEEFTKVDMTSILSSVAELYEHDEKVEVRFRKNSSVYTKGIADELKRVVINLVKNAYEAMPDGGKIELHLYKQQQHIFIEVEDSGSGIPEETRPNIFVPNFSTKSSGTGLGLAICKKIIEAHEGSISFASVEGEGTTFVIKLPQG
jgi:signal transduction histidine kinase